MPNEKLDIETDENPETIYEDTTGHERTGYDPEYTKQIFTEDLDNEEGTDI
jgi:hypothetical protein